MATPKESVKSREVQQSEHLELDAIGRRMRRLAGDFLKLTTARQTPKNQPSMVAL